MTHNEKRIQQYRDRAIAALAKILDEGDSASFLQAIEELKGLQSYLDLSSESYL